MRKQYRVEVSELDWNSDDRATLRYAFHVTEGTPDEMQAMLAYCWTKGLESFAAYHATHPNTNTQSHTPRGTPAQS